MIRSYKTLAGVGSLLMPIKQVDGITCGEYGEIELPDGSLRHCRVLEIEGKTALVELLDGGMGITPAESRVRFLGHSLELSVSEHLQGRVLDGLGTPIDGGYPIPAEKSLPINGTPTNPALRLSPNDLMETGISAIDGLAPLPRGGRLPIFAAPGMDTTALALRLIESTLTPAGEEPVIVFAAIGLGFTEVKRMLASLRRTGAIDHTVLFINLASDPVLERITAPQMAMTAAEHLAFSCGKQVLLILNDLTNYADALRELAAARREQTGRLGYPVSLQSSLAALFERAGRRGDSEGSITLLPILTLPGNSLAHPVPDLVARSADGQLLLSQALWKKGICPPVDPLGTHSRGAARACPSAAATADSLTAAYAASLKGDTTFADTLERLFIHQPDTLRRTAAETAALGATLPSAIASLEDTAEDPGDALDEDLLEEPNTETYPEA